ncbi:MAG: 6-pyruvoyl-tetrahydropterin synthase-related protein, partial [Candidatus Hydrothermarchaeales archaeon]
MNPREWDKQKLVDAMVLVIIFAFLLSYFTPQLLLSKTITTGGDTASHYYSAYFMKNSLLPAGKVVGWTPGNYAGFPMFQFYFFLPFLTMALLSYLIPLQIAFKLVSVLGIFLLPAAAYFGMKAMKFRFPIPAFSAVFMLPFLFMEANSMWGANIPSTLAGEFSFSISMALTLIFLGVLYGEMEKTEGRRSLPLIILLVLITLTHVYTLLFVVATSAYFLAERSREKLARNIVFLFKIYFTAFLLTS